MSSMYAACGSLTSIPQLDTSNATDINNVISFCNSLQNIKINNLKLSISITNSALLTKESLLYMIQNAAPTSAITITLHSSVYDKYIEDGDIVSALSAQPLITLAK